MNHFRSIPKGSGPNATIMVSGHVCKYLGHLNIPMHMQHFTKTIVLTETKTKRHTNHTEEKALAITLMMLCF